MLFVSPNVETPEQSAGAPPSEAVAGHQRQLQAAAVGLVAETVPRGDCDARALCSAGRWAAVGLAGISMSACTPGTSPSLPFFGAYFPFWLICAGVGVIGAAVARLVFVKVGIDEVLPWRILVYGCLAAIIGFALALFVFGR